MARRVKGGPVENEQRTAVAALRLANAAARSGDEARFWAGDIIATLELTEPGLELNASTVNRALNHLVRVGWMWAAWETADPGDRSSSKPRLYYRFTAEGLCEARQIVADKRRAVPVWALYPEEILGEDVDHPPVLRSLEFAASPAAALTRQAG